MKLFLVCHGISLFWYRFPNDPPGLGYDGYTILLPQFNAAIPDHVVRFGVDPGAPIPRFESVGHAAATRQFVLDFGFVEKAPPRLKKNKEEYLLMYRRAAGDVRAWPDIRDDSTAGVGFSMDIPYPTEEMPLRVGNYPEPGLAPYRVAGDGQKDFEITTRKVVDTTAFMFDNINVNRPVLLKEGGSAVPIEVVPAPITADVKLHLYSQPRHHHPGPGSPDHLVLLNTMLNYRRKKFDLELNSPRNAVMELPQLRYGLTEADRNSLAPAPPLEPGGPEILIIDPAECGQGGGC